MTHRPAVVSLRKVSRTFGARTVIGSLDLDIAKGEFVALLGASGCGKSTLLRILAELDREAEGNVQVPARRSVVFQEPRLLPWKRVWKNVTLGLNESAESAKTRARAALAEVGLRDHAEAWPRTLSGGEAQRVALARSLVREPELLLLDEPFGALDALTRIRMHGLLRSLWERHRPAVLLVTHDVDEAILLADRVVVLGQPARESNLVPVEFGSRVVLDVEVGLEHPRSRRDARFADLRRTLLAQLGVEDDEAPRAHTELRVSEPPSANTSHAAAGALAPPGIVV